MSSTDPSAARGVSPVIATILLLAIAVILAAVLALFVLEIATSTEDSVRAGASIDCDQRTSEITVTFSSNQNADHLDVDIGGTTTSLTEVGQHTTQGGLSGDIEVTVTAVAGDRRTVVRETTCENM